MFYMTRHCLNEPANTEVTILLIHTDDADMIGGSEEMFDFICNACDKKWKIERGKPQCRRSHRVFEHVPNAISHRHWGQMVRQFHKYRVMFCAPRIPKTGSSRNGTCTGNQWPPVVDV